MGDPRYDFIGAVDPSVVQTADNFYSNVPDTSWMQARGVMPSQSMNGGYQPQMPPGGYGIGQNNPWQQAQQAYEKDIVKGVSGFDITKPDYQQKVQDYFLNHQDPNASQYPRVQAEVNAALQTHKELKSFMQKNPKAAETYSNLIRQGLSQEDAISQLRDQTARDAENQKTAILLASNGIAPDQHSQYQDKNGNFDPVAANFAIAQAKRANEFTKNPINDEELKMLRSAQQAHADATATPDQADKKGYGDYVDFKQKLMAANPGTNWEQAHAAWEQDRGKGTKQDLVDIIQSLEGANKAVSPSFYKKAGLEPPNFQYNAKGKARQGGAQGAPGQDPFQGTSSTFDPASGQWSGQQAPQVPVVPSQTQQAQVGQVTQLPLSPADLTQGDLYNPAPVQAGFSGVGQQIQQAQIDNQLAQATRNQGSPEDQKLWEDRKQELLKNFPKDLISGKNPLNSASIRKSLFDTLGEDKVQREAFKDSSGRSVPWGEVAYALSNDPRIEQLRKPAPIKVLQVIPHQ